MPGQTMPHRVLQVAHHVPVQTYGRCQVPVLEPRRSPDPQVLVIDFTVPILRLQKKTTGKLSTLTVGNEMRYPSTSKCRSRLKSKWKKRSAR